VCICTHVSVGGRTYVRAYCTGKEKLSFFTALGSTLAWLLDTLLAPNYAQDK
jgi:hypothetical protein